MGDFAADWLRLREPADVIARSLRLTQSVARAVAGEDELLALDLGTGTGSNVRFLAEHLPARQRWLLVDDDSDLLAEALVRMPAWGAERGYTASRAPGELLLHNERISCHIETRCMDLALLNNPAIFAGRALVTASALCDLVSIEWLRALAAACREGGAAVLFALTYDGRICCSPEEPEDDTIRDLVNSHQRTHKRFGVSAGPEAVEWTERCFVELGYQVRREPSDWILSSASRELQRQVIDGWRAAAVAMAPAQAHQIQGWRDRRLAHVAVDRSQLLVGHQDLVAWLPKVP